MTDRELLELAARSAGHEFGWIHDSPRIKGEYGWQMWDSLQDDGDALRLLASMREKFGSMLLAIFEDRVECGDVNYCQSIEDIVDGDIPRAVRRAITRAAAQIQLDKEKQ